MRIVLLSMLLLFFVACGSSGGSGEDHDTPYTPPQDQNSSQESNTSIIFRVSVPQITPQNEFVCIAFNDGNAPHKMYPYAADTWQIELNASDITASEYKYCRNCECEAADEYLGTTGVSWRNRAGFEGGTLYEESVNRWRWLDENLTAIDINTSSYLTNKPDMNKTEYMSGIALNDWWRHEWLDSMDETIQKASDDLDAKWVQIVPVPQIKNINDPATLTIDPYGINGMSDADLNASIESAHNKGLKVFLNPSPWSFEADNADANHTQEWWNSYFTALQPVLEHYARIAQENNVDMFEIRAWPNIDSLTKEEAAKMEDNASALLQEIETLYTGKIAVQSICYDTDRPILDIQRNADYLAINIWQFYPWAFATSADENVSAMRDGLKTHLDDCKSYYDDNNISVPLIIEQLAMASFDGATMSEDVEAIDSFHEDNTSYTLDLQEQADSFEAIFQAMAQEEWIQGHFVFTYFFWDSIGKDINVRGKKPVEDEIKKWHEWLH